MALDLRTELSKRTQIFNLKLWVLIGILVGLLTIIILLAISICLAFRKKTKFITSNEPRLPITLIPAVSKEIRIDQESSHDNDSDKQSSQGKKVKKTGNVDNSSQSGSSNTLEKDGDGSSYSEEKAIELHNKPSNPTVTTPSPLSGLPEFSRTGWGHWFTLRDLETATNRFSKENVIGEGGYGVVFRGHLINGTPVAVKKLLNNLGQAEKEFRVEVEAIGHVRHKNLVRLLGYCIEGTHRMLVYEFVNNGNLEQLLHGANIVQQRRPYLTWDNRMKIILGTAKALAYLHEAIEPKVVHRDIKSSNILVDDDFNAKISDFGLAKLLGAGKSHIATRVMGTFGYVAPEYANSGLLNEKSDVYSFGIVLLEAITGRDPVDYSRPEYEVNMMEWLKTMIGSRRTVEVVDPMIEKKPSTNALKRALLTALRCVDLDADKRPKMGQVVRMLESEEYPLPREDRRHRRNKEKTREEAGDPRENSDTDKSDDPVLKSENRSHHRTGV